MGVQPLRLLEAQAALKCITPIFSSEAILLPFDVLQRHTITSGLVHRAGRRGPGRGGKAPGSVCPFIVGKFSFTMSSLAGQEFSKLWVVFPQSQNHRFPREVVPVAGFYGFKRRTSQRFVFILITC